MFHILYTVLRLSSKKPNKSPTSSPASSSSSLGQGGYIALYVIIILIAGGGWYYRYRQRRMLMAVVLPGPSNPGQPESYNNSSSPAAVYMEPPPEQVQAYSNVPIYSSEPPLGLGYAPVPGYAPTQGYSPNPGYPSSSNPGPQYGHVVGNAPPMATAYPSNYPAPAYTNTNPQPTVPYNQPGGMIPTYPYSNNHPVGVGAQSYDPSPYSYNQVNHGAAPSQPYGYTHN